LRELNRTHIAKERFFMSYDMNMMMLDDGKLQENFWLMNEISESAKVDVVYDQFNLVKQRYELFLMRERIEE
jgi:hypothetical protein